MSEPIDIPTPTTNTKKSGVFSYFTWKTDDKIKPLSENENNQFLKKIKAFFLYPVLKVKTILPNKRTI